MTGQEPSARHGSEKASEATPPRVDSPHTGDLLTEVRHRARARKAQRESDKIRELTLVNRAIDGDARAFRTLVELHQRRLFALAMGMLHDRDDAMDAVQDAFIRAHRKLADFEGNSSFSTWIYRICVNICIDRKRSDARRRKSDLDDAAAHIDAESVAATGPVSAHHGNADPLRSRIRHELGHEITSALSHLTEDHRAILLLREVEGMSYEEISETLGIPRGTVMSRLFHARRKMQRLLRPYLGLSDDEGLDPSRPSTTSGDPSEEEAASRRPTR